MGEIRQVGTIDLTPSWSQIAEILIHTVEEGNLVNREIAEEEIARMPEIIRHLSQKRDALLAAFAAADREGLEDKIMSLPGSELRDVWSGRMSSVREALAAVVSVEVNGPTTYNRTWIKDTARSADRLINARKEVIRLVKEAREAGLEVRLGEHPEIHAIVAQHLDPALTEMLGADDDQ